MNVTLRSGKILDGPSIHEEGESSRKHGREKEQEKEEGTTNESYEPYGEEGKVEDEENEERENEEKEEAEQNEEREDERDEENERREEPKPVEKSRRAEEDVAPKASIRPEKDEGDNDEANMVSKKRGNVSPKHEKGPDRKNKRDKGQVPSEGELNEKLDKQLKGKWNFPDHRPPSPYPMAPADSQQYKGFMQLLKDIVLNISMYDLLCGVPKYGKYIRDMLSGKGRGKLDGVVSISKACSCYIKNDLKILEKKTDPGVPTIPVTIKGTQFAKALCDLGSGVSLMPLTVAQALGVDRELKYTPVMLQLADKSLVKPEGIVEDVLVQVDRFLVPTDFIILDMEADKEVPLLLGRPFLATGDAMIGARNNDVHFNVGEEPVHVESSKTRRQVKNEAGCFFLEVTKSINSSEASGSTPNQESVNKASTISEVDPYEGLTWDNMEPGLLLLGSTPPHDEWRKPRLEPEGEAEEGATVVHAPSVEVSTIKLANIKVEEKPPSNTAEIPESPTKAHGTEAKKAKKKKKGGRMMWIPVGAVGIMKMGKAGPTIAQENMKQTLSPRKEQMKVTSPRRKI